MIAAANEAMRVQKSLEHEVAATFALLGLADSLAGWTAATEFSLQS